MARIRAIIREGFIRPGVKAATLMAAAALLMLLALSLSGCGSADKKPAAPSFPERTGPTNSVPVIQAPPEFTVEPPDPAALEEQWGLKLETATLTALDRMIDLRLKVTDPAKVGDMANKLKETFLVHEGSSTLGTKATSSKVGDMRAVYLEQEGVVSYILLNNPNMLVKHGDAIIVVAKDVVLGRITVQ